MASAPDEDKLDVREIYERYGRAVYRRCQYFLRDDDQAHDAMHDVFLKVVERADEFRADASPFTWVVSIATNHCLNILRARRATWRSRYEQTVKVDAELRSGDLGERLDRQERNDLLRAVLERADPKARAAAVYYFVDEMSQEQAAKAAGCSVPTLRKRLRSFIKSARRLLRGIDPEAVFGEPPV